MRKIVLSLAAAAATLTAMPAAADPPSWARAHGRRAHDVQQYNRYNYPAYSRYDRHGRLYRDQRLGRSDYVWRGSDSRYYCRRSDGTTGLLVGGAAGAVLGSQIAGRGDHLLGAILGGVGGALLGKSIDRGEVRCR